MHARLLELLASKRIRPIVDSVVPFDGLPAGLEAMEARKTIGRIVVEI